VSWLFDRSSGIPGARPDCAGGDLEYRSEEGDDWFPKDPVSPASPTVARRGAMVPCTSTVVVDAMGFVLKSTPGIFLGLRCELGLGSTSVCDLGSGGRASGDFDPAKTGAPLSLVGMFILGVVPCLVTSSRERV
jgi:hypothetical protein